MNVNGIGAAGYLEGYKTRRTGADIISKNIAGEDEIYHGSSSNAMYNSSNAMHNGSWAWRRNNFMDRYIKETEEAGVKQAEESGQTQEVDSITDLQINMLVSDTVQARFPLQEMDKEGSRMEEMYLIAVDKDGIRCSKPGQDKYEWEILFTDESQYESATEFLNYARGFMDNFLFAAHENFWEDYLNGNMDVDGFKRFLEGTNNGIPDYAFTVGDSMYIDKEKAQWAQYMNLLGAKFYTEEEMAQMKAELIEKNTAGAAKLSDSYAMLYKKLHPEYNGERIFCEYPGGPLYTADEIMEVMNRNGKDAEHQAEATGFRNGGYKQAGNQVSETTSDIIIKPDGSRVLVITVNIGGMATTMSMEISKPTDALNEAADQEVADDKQSLNNVLLGI